jgi:hypothetical protein
MASDWDTLEGLVGEPRFSVRKNASLLSHFYIEKSPDHFAKTGSGQTWETLRKYGVVYRGWRRDSSSRMWTRCRSRR